MKKTGAMVVWLLLAAGVAGHHGPEEVIAELSAKLATRPDDLALLSRRATEYRALGMHSKAEADLRRVLARQPGSVAETESLARVLWAQGRAESALVMVQRAAGLAKPGRERAACLILEAGWQLERNRIDKAHAACREAFREDPVGMVDWYLLRGRVEEQRGTSRERVAGLKAGYEVLGSVVLRNAWVDASIDAGMFAAVTPVIESELGRARLKSSWLIRRGRVRLGTHAKEEGRSDLRAAIAELDRRIHPARPDAKLLVDRGWAKLWIGEAAAARADLVQARKHGGDPWETERLAGTLGQ
jgi:tetratricopeptide (TPR) repeat protein